MTFKTRLPLALMAMLLTTAAYATKTTPEPPKEDPDAQATSDSAAEASAQAAAAAKAAAGASAQTTVTSSPTVTTELSAPSTSAINSRHTAIGLSMEGPIPLSAVDCWKPAAGYKRGHRMLFGAWEVSAIMELDQGCVAIEEAKDNRRLEMMRLELELERERNRRLELETKYVEQAGK